MSTADLPMEKPRGLDPKWKVLISVIFGIFMIILDSTIVNIAFPTLRVKFGASLSEAQWVISIYVLALGVTTPVSGFLADRFDIKRIYLLGLGDLHVGLAPVRLRPVAGAADRGPGPAGHWRRDVAAAGPSAALPRLSAQGAGHGAGYLRHRPGGRAGAGSDPGRLAGGPRPLAR